MKLDTATDILEWAGKSSNWPNATAERLAYCVRVTEIVEHAANRDPECWHREHCVHDVLAEAAQKEGK